MTRFLSLFNKPQLEAGFDDVYFQILCDHATINTKGLG